MDRLYTLPMQKPLAKKAALSFKDKKAIVAKAVEFAKERLSKDGTGHDWWHIQRVWNNAKAINTKEKADQFIIDLAVLLHDVGDRKVIGTSEDDYSIAEGCLVRNGVDTETVQKVIGIIKNMSFSSSLDQKNAKHSKELQIVQDADRLDALGAIGIARLFAYGGSAQRILHDPTKKPERIRTKVHYRKIESSSFNHFYEKILLLKDLMNTKTAKTIAQKRHAYVKEYMKQFLAEWKGKS